MFKAAILLAIIAVCADAFMVTTSRKSQSSLNVFSPKQEAGISGPFGYFDPFSLAPSDGTTFKRYKESELKHGRVAMLAFLGIVAGELIPNGFDGRISGPAINQFQQAADIIPAFTQNVIGFILAVEGFNIVKGWQSAEENESSPDYDKNYPTLAGLKAAYVNGDLKFDPLGLKPKDAAGFKSMQTKEINNGRLAMLAVAGIVAQELVTESSIF